MDETRPTIPPASAVSDGEPARRWPACVAFLLSWCLPATTAGRTGHVSLERAFVAHVLAALTAIVLITLFVLIAETPHSLTAPDIMDVADDLLDVFLDDFAGGFRRRPKEAVLVTICSGAGIELGIIAVALLFTPWGAQDERLRSSFVNALRRVWLHTTHILVAVFLVGMLGTGLSRMETAWNAAYPPSRPEPPQPPTDAPQGSQAWQDYDNARREYWRENSAWWNMREREKPWYFRQIEAIMTNASVASVLWILWALLRAVGVRRDTPPASRPPTCEACGYNLSTIPMESRCPECGEPVLSSLGPDARAGTPWQMRRELGRPAAWWRCCVDSFARPGLFGRRIQTVSPRTDHRRFLAMHLPIVFILTVAGVISLYVIDTGDNPFVGEPMVVFILCPILGTVVTLAMLGATMLTAGLVGLWYVIQDRRNLLTGSMQVAAYLAGYLTLWIAFAWTSGVLVVAWHEARFYRVLQDATMIDDSILAFMTWFAPNLVCVVAYFGLVARGTAGLRYANR